VLDRDAIASRYARVRARTEALAAPLSAEDAMVQSMPDASPTKWHLAHTTWFFEEFLLSRVERAHAWPDERWRVLFNSYYEAVGPQHARGARGVLARPSLAEVRAWRAAVDERVGRALRDCDEDARFLALLGTHHEEQHQELLLTDIQHALWSSELRSAYAPVAPGAVPARPPSAEAPLSWVARGEAVVPIGASATEFSFDNERARHSVVVDAFSLASRLVTNEEYAHFVDDGGYQRPELWLSDGWAVARAGGWRAPLYWERVADGRWAAFGLRGVRPLETSAPVAHVSYYEADAYARWAEARLPTEAEWESVASEVAVEGTFLDGGALAPAACPTGAGVQQLFGDVWQWTSSAYLPYPRFRAAQGALGEYNGKFMSGQMVLRGGSCFSPREHLRATYRNFFPPAARWQASGVRLARDA
jgi:ergothioneine biosynthesis protein EgtB